MRVSFTFDDQELHRERFLYVVQNPDPIYAIKSDPIYQPVREFFTTYKKGYPFRLINLLHVTAIKMFEHSINQQRLRRLGSLFATTGLYLALDTKHPDLAIHEHFGDFTAGFSHQFGVGLTALVMSHIFGIPFDQMNRIRVQGRPVLDYEANIPTGGILQIEAKGITRSDGRGSARKSICKKKVTERQRLQQQAPGISVTRTAMIGVIIQAARSGQTNTVSSRKSAEQGLIEIIDPDFGGSDAVPSEENLLAGIYRHYAAVALFAGLYNVAAELLERANAQMTGKARAPQGRNIRFDERAVLHVGQRNLVGIQWRPSDRAELADDVWFYQAADRDIIRELIVNDVFPNTQPYHGDQPLSRNNEYIESILPDGSYFGIGTIGRNALRTLNPRDIPFIDV